MNYNWNKPSTLGFYATLPSLFSRKLAAAQKSWSSDSTRVRSNSKHNPWIQAPTVENIETEIPLSAIRPHSAALFNVRALNGRAAFA